MKKISRRNFLKGAAVLGTAAAMTACGGSSSSTSTAASTSAAASTGAASAAEASGKLVIYSPNSDTQIDCTLTNGFMVKYPNIEVELQSMGTGDVLARIEAEKENPQADIDWGAINFNFYKQHPDLWESYVSPNEANLDENYRNNTDGNVTYCNLSGSGCFILNNTLLKELGVEVKGYADLLQPELKGKIAMGDPTASSSAFAELTNMLLVMGEGETPAECYQSDAAWDHGITLQSSLTTSTASCCPAPLRCTRMSSPVSMPWAFPTRTPLCRPSSTTRTTPTPTCRWCTPKRVPCGCPPVSPS